MNTPQGYPFSLSLRTEKKFQFRSQPNPFPLSFPFHSSSLLLSFLLSIPFLSYSLSLPIPFLLSFLFPSYSSSHSIPFGPSHSLSIPIPIPSILSPSHSQSIPIHSSSYSSSILLSLSLSFLSFIILK